MPLFDINTALSGELKAAYQLADRLSELTAVKNLAETLVTAEALDKITVGIAADPFEGDAYTLQELENRHFFAQVYAEPEEGHVAGLAPEAVGNPREGGVFCVYLRRQVRDSEDRTDAYNFFWDRVSAIGTQLIQAAEALAELTNRNRFKQVGRAIGPEFGRRRSEADQGDYLEALLKVTWGDVANE
jgi:hypothetical protein